MDTQSYNDLILFFKKFLAWFLPSSLGVATKLAYESRAKQLKRSHVMASIIMACFVGYICDSLCTSYGLTTLRGMIVALGALASESFIQFFFKNDTNIIKAAIFRLFNINVDKPTENNTNNNVPNTEDNGDTSDTEVKP